MSTMLKILGVCFLVVVAGFVGLLVWSHSKGESVQEEFYTAVLSGDPAQVLAKFEPALVEKVDVAVLALWMKAVKTHLGAYQGLSGSNYSTSAKSVNGQSHVESEGTLRFEKGEAHSKLHFVDGKVKAFLLTSAHLPENWFTEAPETAEYVARGQALIEDLLSGRADAAYAKLHESVRKKTTAESLRTMMEQVSSRLGALESVTPRDHEFIPGDVPELVLTYDVTCEKGAADGRVGVQFDPWKSWIVSFNIEPR